jgi:hypothetical protein
MVSGVGGVERRYENMDFRARNFIANGVNVLGSDFTTGNTFYVSSAVSNGDGLTPASALSTIDAAIGLCTANKGDRIYVLPNHEETITTAAGIAADVAGVSIIGLGNYNQRPRVLLDGATDVTVAVSAADVTFHNIVFASGHADIVTCFNITAAGCTLSALEFVNNVVDENFLTEIKATSTTDNNADGLTVVGCRAFTVDASALEFIELNADINAMVVRNNFVCKDAATAGKFMLCATGKDVTNCHIENNRLVTGMTAGDLFIDNDTTANSGIVAWNFVGHHDTAGAVPFDCDGVRLFQNYAVSDDTTQGVLFPAADTID